MSIETLLDRLDKVRQSGQGRWLARCPAHDDHGPSLSLRVLDDGRVLVHCFAGCPASDIVAAVGMTLADLFPPKPVTYHKPERRPYSASDVLTAVAYEVEIVAAAGDSILQGRLGQSDQVRLNDAVARLRAAMQLYGGRDHG